MLAHINEKGKKQTVNEHLIGTANKSRGEGKITGIENIAFLTGLFHDLGKNREEFNRYLIEVTEDKKSHRRGEVDHSTAGGQYIYKNYYDSKDIYNKIVVELISNAIISHHGIKDIVDINGKEEFLSRMEKPDIGYEEVLSNSKAIFEKYDIDLILSKGREEFKRIFLAINDLVKNNDGNADTAYFMLGCLQRLITSILIDADRTDTAEFMTEHSLKKDIDYNSLWCGYAEKLNNRLMSFKGTDDISKLRRQMSEECFEFAKKGRGIYCLPVPTGGGKTLASLRYALEHCRIYNKKRIIYIAPYLSILEQNAKEIKSILNDDENILEHHSNIIIDNKEEKNIYKYLSDMWTSPVILTSMVRFLETLFGGDTTSVRRFNKLADSVIIIDEIQNLPVKIINLFNIMADFLSYICNATIILCSATQPLLDRTDKKIIYSNPKNMISDVDSISEAFRRVRIVDNTKIEKYSTEELADFIFEKAEDNMLVILNTKAAVRKLCKELNDRNSEYEIYQLTTYMCPQHRNDVIDEIKAKLGNTKIICVSTQLIEAGVDISFSNVIRSLAGLDSIIQAAGRCNRHGGSEIRKVFIVNYIEENVTGLEDIKIAQDKMFNLLLKYKNHYDEYGPDYLLSNKAINEYYEEYFFKRKRDMNYTLNHPENLFNLLSRNKISIKERKKPNGTILTQAYREAGDNFNVIDSNTVGVIVPYKESIDKINKLLSSNDFNELRSLINSLQRYTVNLYDNDEQLKKLEQRKAVISCLDGSLYILSEGFYKEDIGLSSELENYIF